MGDPRWFGATNEDELERELLGSLRDVAPPPGAKGETWNRLAVQVAAAATIGTASAAAHAVGSGAGAALQATKVLTVKVAASIALTGSLAVGGGWWIHRQMTAPPAVPIAAEHVAFADRVARPALPVLAPPQEAEETVAPSLPAPVDPAERASKGVEARPRSDQLSLESRMLTEARAQLRGGDPRAALATLERLRARAPKGVLMQERDVLAIQIASALGDSATARRRAKEFLDAHPESPHAPQLRRLATDP
jgi:hypothetical protein